MIRALISFLIVTIFAALFGGAYWYYHAEAKTAAGGPPAGGFAFPIEGALVASDVSRESVFAVGTLMSSQSVVIRAEVTGRIAALNLDEGKPVQAGQLLIQLDASVEKAELAQARAALELSRANFERANELLKRGTGTQRALDEARAALKSDEARLGLAQARLEKLTINAPFAGVLGLKRVSLGDYVAPGAEIINLEKIDPLQVEFRIPERYLPTIAVGNTISLSVDAYPDRQFEGEVFAINPLVAADGRALVLRAQINNSEALLRPGLFARVTLRLTVRKDALFIPESAIVPVGNGHFVYRIDDGKASFVPVKIGVRQGGQVEIVDGLKRDELVVSAGTNKVFPGAPVRAVNLPPPAAAPVSDPAKATGG